MPPGAGAKALASSVIASVVSGQPELNTSGGVSTPVASTFRAPRVDWDIGRDASVTIHVEPDSSTVAPRSQSLTAFLSVPKLTPRAGQPGAKSPKALMRWTSYPFARPPDPTARTSRSPFGSSVIQTLRVRWKLSVVSRTNFPLAGHSAKAGTARTGRTSATIVCRTFRVAVDRKFMRCVLVLAAHDNACVTLAR